MDAMTLIPAPDAIPVAWGWFEGLNMLTFALHIILVNILVGGGILALYTAMRGDPAKSAKTITARLPTVFALAVNLGVAPLLFLQVLYGNFFYTSSILAAVWWLGVILLLIFGYYLLYIAQYRQKTDAEGGRFSLGAALVLVLCISLIMASILTMTPRPEMWTAYVGKVTGLATSVSAPTFVPRYLHFFFASLAVGGLVLALTARYGPLSDPEAASRNVTLGMKWFTVATILQMAVGLWWLMALEQNLMLRFMGGSIVGTLLLVLGLGLALAALVAGIGKKPVAAAVWTGLTIAVMTGLRAVLRNETLAPWFSPGNLEVTGEYSPLVLFATVLVLGLASLAYMLKLAFRRQ